MNTTQLDQDILQWIARETRDAALTQQIESAAVSRRDYMRTGWFVYFDAPETMPVVAEGVRPVCPRIESPQLMDGAGCSLFLRRGRLHYLEVYTRGAFLGAASVFPHFVQ